MSSAGSELERLIESFIAELRLTKSPHTAYNYHKHLRKFAEWCQKSGTDFLDLDTKKLRRFRNELVAQNFKPSTINAILSAVKAFYDFLVDEEYLQGNPIVMKRLRVPEPKRQPKFLTEEELSAAWKALQQLPENVRLAFETMLASGLRVSEAAGLCAEDVVVKNGKVFLHVAKGKGAKERYAVVVDPAVARKLVELSKKKKKGESLFGVSASTLKAHAWKVKKETGVNFHSHRLRHTFATRLLSQGVPIDVVQKALGHSNISTTRKYAETLPEALERLSASLEFVPEEEK